MGGKFEDQAHLFVLGLDPFSKMPGIGIFTKLKESAVSYLLH